ncbi:hypothetical protein GA0116948_101160 [Chitinophaga costaii]|uniref:Uncharacterized protein n=1 Tax=Chitinophaga costaii TaxID=1335309 RepID=A0A1C3YY82_9BACT|nr:hypothetical protein [Chitinophaga costaii]PUZ30153.1 hypothetical protein DCM91_01380 [Chitinophaga costaii]SCB75039.1 hypothetical protein GA0116948_101160 [Chitinophaga costaii]
MMVMIVLVYWLVEYYIWKDRVCNDPYACLILFIIGLPNRVINTHRSKFLKPRKKYFLYLFWGIVLLNVYLKLTGMQLISNLLSLLNHR